MTEYIKRFLEANKDDVSRRDILELYRKISASGRTRELTMTLLQAGVDPLENLTSVPTEFAEDVSGIREVSGESGNNVWETIFLNSNIRVISNFAFCACNDLEKVTIPSSVTYIMPGAFSNCENLKTVDLSQATNLSEIDSSAFLNTPISTIEFPESLREIGGSCFRDCANLSKIDLKNVEKIGIYAFARCSSLTEVIVPRSVTSLGRHTFSGCSALESAEIYANIRQLPKQLFSSCESLTSVLIGNGIQQIDPYSFSGCYGLERIMLPKTLKAISSSLFDDCYSLQEIFFSGTTEEFEELCMKGSEDVAEFLSNIKVSLPRFEKINCMNGVIK